MNCNSKLFPLRSVEMKDNKKAVAGGRMMTQKTIDLKKNLVGILMHMCMLKRMWANV